MLWRCRSIATDASHGGVHICVKLIVARRLQGDVQQELPSAQVILLNQSDEGYFLYRYTATGQSGGDTGHLTLDDALYQAQFEYGDGLTDWYPAPQNVDDVLTIALNHLARG